MMQSTFGVILNYYSLYPLSILLLKVPDNPLK